jgi:glycogen synthase
MTTVPFLPKLGGIETVVSLLARELTTSGSIVKIVTSTPSKHTDDLPYDVVRRPSFDALLRLYLWADVYLQHGPALRFAWPALLRRRASVIVHHIWLPHRAHLLLRHLRGVLLKNSRNFAVSRALAASLPVPCEIVANPYDDQVFRLMPEIERSDDVAFLGRLEPLKGTADLLEAIASLKDKHPAISLTIIGGGSQRPVLEHQARNLSLTGHVRFLGEVPTDEVVRVLNRHKILVVPSRYDEPFGVVALEGIACGCVIVGSSGGGLPEAIGECGLLFPNGDVPALAQRIDELLSNPAEFRRFQRSAPAHLACHRASTVAQQYSRILSAYSRS